MLEDLSREELRDLMESYNNYVMNYNEEHDEGEPVSIYEYYDNEYQLEKYNDKNNEEDIELLEDYEDEDYDDDYEEEDYIDDYEDEEDYIEGLKGVGVRDTENGFKIVLMGVESGVIGDYDIEMNIKGYEIDNLFNICYNISQRINHLYYEMKGQLTKEQVVNVVREEMIK